LLPGLQQGEHGRRVEKQIQTDLIDLIHVLPSRVANQIAAGEVVERPASVVKELMENSLDAGARRIDVRIEQAGKKLIEVDDDGCGMSAADACLCLKRHATSKISNVEDLHAIASLGFRGEALPSIASVSRFSLYTALAGADVGTEVRVEDADRREVKPAPPRSGTLIRVRDLFLNTPARLRFLRTDRTEEGAVFEIVRLLALANPAVAMHLEINGRRRLDAPGNQSGAGRVGAIMGSEFAANSLEFSLEHGGMTVQGHFGLPTFHHRDSSRLLFFINGRVVRDRKLITALRAGYRDVIFHDRFPQAVVWLEIDPADVDINVHPAKLEVRFKAPQDVRGALVATVRAAISCMGKDVSSVPAQRAMQAMTSPSDPGQGYPGHSRRGSEATMRSLFSPPRVEEPVPRYQPDRQIDLGSALAQIHSRYILAITADGIVLVDQHAAHERIGYEALKCQLKEGEIGRQLLLSPEIWHAGLKMAPWLHDHLEALTVFGFEVEAMGDEIFVIRSMPAMLSRQSPVELLAELVETLMDLGFDLEGKGRILERWLGNHACRASIKSGRILKREEQDALLRQMEKTENIAQCNHGRPTYIRLSLNDLDRLFGR